MRKTGFIAALGLLVAAALSACGGGDAFQTPGSSTTTGANAPATVTVLASTPTLDSSDALAAKNPVVLTAYVRNASNAFVSGAVVTFAATSGGISVTQATSDDNGKATANLMPAGDPSNRTITVTATVGSLSGTVKVDVTGTALSFQGPTALNYGQQGSYSLALVDSAGTGIAGKAVTLASARGNTLSATSVTTDSTGHATFTMTASQSASDTITAKALTSTAKQDVAVNGDGLTFTSPAASPVPQIALGATQAVTVRRTVAGVAAPGVAVNFSTTRGTVTPATVTTDASGNATATVSATNAGGAVITATSGTSASALAVEFVATTPASIDIQPDTFAVSPGNTVTLTAVVRDAANNLVKGQTVDFQLTDTTGGSLSLGSAVTDSQGSAQTVYTAGSTTSASNGVRVTATVHGSTITDYVDLTVSGKQLFIALGTGNSITEPDAATYQIQFTVIVTDANGVGIANVPLTMKILSTHYYKGNRDKGTSSWVTTYTVPGPPQWCADEDVNHNGTLDTGEDFNGDGILEAGNIASVAPVSPATSVVTGSDGRVLVNITYPQQYAYYLDVALSASTSVAGTEYARTDYFMLPGSSTDFNTLDNSPPGMVSPFGKGTTCNVAN